MRKRVTTDYIINLTSNTNIPIKNHLHVQASASQNLHYQNSTQKNKQIKFKNQGVRGRILKIAWKLFLQYGYKRTSLQMIVKESGGSLATIYKIFNDKKTLFSEAIRENGQEFIDSLERDFSEVMVSQSNLEEYFYRIGVRLVHKILSKESITLMRLIIIEGYENSELIEIFHQIIAGRTRHFFIKALESYNATHNLEIENIDESLYVFTNLITEPYLIHTIMIANYARPSTDEIHRTVTRAIKVFMLYLKHYKEIK